MIELNVLPAKARLLPLDYQKIYLQVFGDVVQRQSEEVAHMVAWEYVTKRMTEVPAQVEATNNLVLDDNGMPEDTEDTTDTTDAADTPEMPEVAVAAKQAVTQVTVTTTPGDSGSVTVTFSLQPMLNGNTVPGVVLHAEGDQMVFNGLLADDMMNKDGKKWSRKALQEFATYINKNGLYGDISDEEVHAEFNNLIREYGHLSKEEFVKTVRLKRSGIVKAVKAKYEDGKLYIKGVIDKRYKRLLDGVENLKMSIEAWVPEYLRTDTEYLGGHVLGLTLVDDRAVNPRTFAVVDV